VSKAKGNLNRAKDLAIDALTSCVLQTQPTFPSSRASPMAAVILDALSRKPIGYSIIGLIDVRLTLAVLNAGSRVW
jgi:hypothetical protein